MNRPDFLESLLAIDTDTMIVVGDGDRVTPAEHAEEMHGRIRGSRLYRIRDCGHLPALESPEEVTRLLRQWLLR